MSSRSTTVARIGSREEWRAARERLLEREKEHTRLGDELSRQRRELPWVRVTEDYLLRYRRRREGARRAVRRAIPAARLPLHVRPQLRGRLPGQLIDRRHRRRRTPAPARSRRDLRARLTSTAGEAAALQAPHGLESSLGLLRAHRLQLRPWLLAHRGTGPPGCSADDGQRATADRRAKRALDRYRRRWLPDREPRVQHLRTRRRHRLSHRTRRRGVAWSSSWATTRSSTTHPRAATKARTGSSGSADTTSTRASDVRSRTRPRCHRPRGSQTSLAD